MNISNTLGSGLWVFIPHADFAPVADTIQRPSVEFYLTGIDLSICNDVILLVQCIFSPPLTTTFEG